MLALPCGLDIGDFLGHIALPAKIAIQVLEPIDPYERFGPKPDADEVYNSITQLCSARLTSWPPSGAGQCSGRSDDQSTRIL